MNHHHNQQQERPPPDLKVMLGWGLFLVEATAYLAICQRWLRGWNGTTLMTKLVGGLALPPLLWGAGGGGHPLLFQAVHYGLIGSAVLLHLRAKRKAAEGVLTSSRFVGFPLVHLLLPGRLTERQGLFVEAATWAALGFLFRWAHEPGLGFLMWCFAATVPVERLVVNRRTEVQIRDTLDAAHEQADIGRQIKDRMGRF